MDTDLKGEICALAAAMTWATALVLFKRSGERVPPLPLNLFKNVTALILLVVTLALMGEGMDELRKFAVSDMVILSLSGFLGIAVADTTFFYALNLIGVGLVTIAECLYSPLIIFFSILLLGESLSVAQIIGTVMILAAVYVSSKHAPPANRTKGQLVLGMFLGAISMALMAFGIVIAKPVLTGSEFPLIWAAFLRLLAGTATLAVVVAASPKRKEFFSVFKPSRIWWYSLPASVLGAYLAMILWIAGFKYTKASTAGILNQTSVVFALILATVILKEPFTRRKLASVILAMAGVLLITFWDSEA